MSYRTIFSVINERTVSTVIARYALSLAAACKSHVVLYACPVAGGTEIFRRNTERHLKQITSVAATLGVPVRRIVDLGDIATLLPERAQDEKADLVFYPLMPYKKYGADEQRDIIRQLLRKVTSNLAIMRAVTMARPHPGNILVPLGKVITGTEQRLLFLSELARSFHSQVTLYHLSAGRESKGMPDAISLFRKQLELQKIMVTERMSAGSTGKSITVEAITRHNDLVLLGASERGMLRKLFFGDPVGDVMHQPPCNTVLFRAAR